MPTTVVHLSTNVNTLKATVQTADQPVQQRWFEKCVNRRSYAHLKQITASSEIRVLVFPNTWKFTSNVLVRINAMVLRDDGDVLP